MTIELKHTPKCSICGSDRILKDAWAAWDNEAQEWVLHSTLDQEYCEQCDGECSVSWEVLK